jgi:hypothetical protein
MIPREVQGKYVDVGTISTPQVKRAAPSVSAMVERPTNNREVYLQSPQMQKDMLAMALPSSAFVQSVEQPKTEVTTKPPAYTPSSSSVDLAKIASLESGKAGYTAYNKGSGAYGKYQFIPSTAAAYSKKLGFKGDEWKLPENQEKMFSAFMQDNAAGLKRKGLPVDTFHVYGAHQQGLTGFTNILNNNISPKLERNMRSNLPSSYRNLEGEDLRNAWLSYWRGKV